MPARLYSFFCFVVRPDEVLFDRFGENDSFYGLGLFKLLGKQSGQAQAGKDNGCQKFFQHGILFTVKKVAKCTVIINSLLQTL